jgi:Cu/Ag efflux pump CusA
MALYNMTQLQEAYTVSKLVVFANDATQGVLFSLFIIVIFFVMLMTFKRWDFQDSLLTSSFLCLILSSILAYGGFIILYIPLAFLIITALTALYAFTVGK